jgi:hypothetical protein
MGVAGGAAVDGVWSVPTIWFIFFQKGAIPSLCIKMMHMASIY